MSAALAEIEVLRQSYTAETNPRRFDGVVRNYTVHDVPRLRGTVRILHTLAEMGARRLWDLLHSEDYVHALGALTGNQAVQMVRAGLQAISSRGGKSPPTRTRPARCTPTKASIRSTAFRTSYAR